MIDLLGEKYLTEKEAAAMMGYSRVWLQRARYEKTGPKFTRMSVLGKILYKKSTIEKWIKDRISEN